MSGLSQAVIDAVTRFGLKVIGAIAIVVVGRWIIRAVIRFTQRAMTRQAVDPTLIRYLGNTLSVGMNIALVVGILGYFGLETTSFAALIAALGIAIGSAWGGLLANLAAGAFLILLRPFKVGDFVTAGGVTGTVSDIGMFATTINSSDNIRTYVGNNRIFSDTIQNFSANSYRRVDIVAQIAHTTDHRAAISLLREGLLTIPNVLSSPSPSVEILQFTLAGPVLAVRPSCHNDHYWQVYFDTNRLIRESFGEAGFAVPEQAVVLRSDSPPAP